MYIVLKNDLIINNFSTNDIERAKEVAVGTAEMREEVYVVLEVIARATPQKRPVLLEEVKKDV